MHLEMKTLFFNGVKEFLDAIQLWRLWGFWGWLDVRQRYRRSLLGPFWVTMTMGFTILLTGAIYSYLFRQEISVYLPYVATGIVLWSLMSGFVGDACTVFIQNEAFIAQLKLSYLIYPIRLLWRYVIVFLHHAVVLILVLILFSNCDLTAIIGATLGLACLLVNIFWIGLLCGLLSVRLRDLPILITSILQLLFMITPVIWPAKALGEHLYLVNWNPVFHLIECVRGPLFSEAMPILNRHLGISLALALSGSVFTITLYSSWRRRLLYWL
jgi:ABC-type polysaccharide/polyol phosphate export permease